MKFFTACLAENGLNIFFSEVYMKTLGLSGVLLLSLLSIAVSCGGDSKKDSAGPDPTVYVGGYCRVSDKDAPCYWKGNERIDLPLPAAGIAGNVQSLYLYGDEVYTCGWFTTAAAYFPCYWTGITLSEIPVDTGRKAGTHAIAVDGGAVYTGGTECALNNTDIQPSVWKGFERTALNRYTDGSAYYPAGVKAIWVTDGTVYASGYYDNGSGMQNACFWTGSTMTQLADDDASNSDAGSIVVYDGIVYCGGYYQSGTSYLPCYWAGTQKTDFEKGSETRCFVNSLTVSDGTVYACGYYINGSVDTPCYWIGTKRYEIALPYAERDAYMNAVAVYNGIIFIAGSYSDNDWKRYPCTWRNGVRTDLSFITGSTFVGTTSIALQ
jgi:hypothetical protein